MNLLLVDDHRLSRSLMADGLRSHDFSVVEAHDAISAVQAFRTQSFDIVVTDIVLPATDGIELAKLLRAEQPDTNSRELRIVALTGNAIAHKESSRYTVFDLVLSKPISVDEMVMALLRLPAPQKQPY